MAPFDTQLTAPAPRSFGTSHGARTMSMFKTFGSTIIITITITIIIID
jgi:hypothetical protein